MEKQMEEDMETGIVWWLTGFRASYNSLPYDSTLGVYVGVLPPNYGLFEGVEGVWSSGASIVGQGRDCRWGFMVGFLVYGNSPGKVTLKGYRVV